MSKAFQPMSPHLVKIDEATKYCYRYDYHMELGVFQTPITQVELRCFPVTKETPKGYWISVFGTRKWVSKTARKRYAYDTKEGALESFRIRTTRRISFLKRDLGTVLGAINATDNDLLKLNKDGEHEFYAQGIIHCT